MLRPGLRERYFLQSGAVLALAARHLRCAVLVCLYASMGFAQSGLAANTAPAAITQHSLTRETDYTLGSIARQHLTLHVPQGYVLDMASLPVLAHKQPALHEPIELRDVSWQVDTDLTQTHTDRWQLVLDWQIFVAADTNKIMPLRPLHLQFKRGADTLRVEVPPDKVIVSSLLPPRMDDAHVQLYADVPAPDWPLPPLLWAAAPWLALWLLTLGYAGWVLGWWQLSRETRMPFRQAWRQLRKLDVTQQQTAMQVLSRAMNQYAGYTVTLENLSRLLDQHPALQPYTAGLQQFYQQVQQVFFAGGHAELSVQNLRQLARALSRLELS